MITQKAVKPRGFPRDIEARVSGSCRRLYVGPLPGEELEYVV